MRMSQGSYPYTGPGETALIGFTEWGRRDNRDVVVCVHGLSRQGRDFDTLAKALEGPFRVLCPDMVGRGRSAWLTDKSKYGLDTYVAHVNGLLEYRALPAVDWVGTSMGGMIGMALAASERSPIKRLILNDIGPHIPAQAQRAIGQYVGKDPRFPSQLAVLDYLKQVHAGFGPMDEAEWAAMVAHSVIRQADRSYSLHYDPAIGAPFKEPYKDIDLWALWERVEVPVLVLRGRNSELLTRRTTDRMRERRLTEVVEIPDCGHAPSLTRQDQVKVVKDWLLHWLEQDEVERRYQERLAAEEKARREAEERAREKGR